MTTYLIIWLVLGFITTMIASSKGLNTALWFFIGFGFGPLGLLCALLASEDEEQVESKMIRIGTLKICPKCAETIKNNALICKHCGCDNFDDDSSVDDNNVYLEDVEDVEKRNADVRRNGLILLVVFFLVFLIYQVNFK